MKKQVFQLRDAGRREVDAHCSMEEEKEAKEMQKCRLRTHSRVRACSLASIQPCNFLVQVFLRHPADSGNRQIAWCSTRDDHRIVFAAIVDSMIPRDLDVMHSSERLVARVSGLALAAVWFEIARF
jgi:hypothetical protein